MSFPALPAPADAERWAAPLPAPLGTPAPKPPCAGGARARCIVGAVVWPDPVCDYKSRDPAPLPRLARSPPSAASSGLLRPGAGRSGESAGSFPGANDGSRRGTGRSLARGVDARPTCSFAWRPRRSSPVSPRRRRRNAEGAEGARGGGEMAETVADTRRLITKPQNLNDAYGPPSNFLEIDVSNPQTVGVGRGRFTTYEIRVKVRLPFSPTARPPPPVPARPQRPEERMPSGGSSVPAGSRRLARLGSPARGRGPRGPSWWRAGVVAAE